MALSGMLSFFNLRNIEFSILSPEDIFALKAATIKIKAKNKYFFEAFLLRVKLLNSETIIPYLKGEGIFNIVLAFPKRGKYAIKELTVSSYFPFYFFKKQRNIQLKYEVTVLPFPLKCDILSLIADGKTKTESNISQGKAYEGELTGVRSYNQGDSLKYIHWKATAKTSEIKTKEFAPPAGNPVIINLNDFTGSTEEKISRATYALIVLSKAENPVGLKLGDEVYKPETGQSHLRRMLYALAVYQQE
ncbi:DUF58 domain-containing protein [Thermodesulfovibrio thiophilus]|uniref:DUF58 domain-containing protein n=1 Tax=Thermodesulfovibrio thiophilus TaxID=340095 RepID=UPI00040CBCB0|nr:DUF58 domain-containing protein [Thermodesulfovibrio thiophilus]HOA82868.1 DUF58 domain-containing protein [Thermodesulfovibrio thiophilus]